MKTAGSLPWHRVVMAGIVLYKKLRKGNGGPRVGARRFFFSIFSVSTGFGGKLCGKYGKLSRSGVLMGLTPCYPRIGLWLDLSLAKKP